MTKAMPQRDDRHLLTGVPVIGAGLAGCEAAWQLACRGVPVRLIDMKPDHYTPAHQLPTLAELVCSNSLRSARLENAVGLLKEELRRLGSLIMACADKAALPAGGALAVDRTLFSRLVTTALERHPLVERVTEQVSQLPRQCLAVVATGPLTADGLFESIRQQLAVQTLHFFDAAAPIVTAESIDMTVAFRQSRYGRGGDDYINCPLDEAQYARFYAALVSARTAEVHAFDKKNIFEGCMPLEIMAARGRDTIRFGPLKPVGLVDPRTGRAPYACVQLRQDNRAASLYNLVGFQTRLAFPEQKRVFALIPGLEKAEFVRYGVMHRNTYLPSPRVLDADYSVRGQPWLYFAGQITGVEGYVESTASGLVAGWQAALQATGLPPEKRHEQLPSACTVTGALGAYVSDQRHATFQPMNASFALLDSLADSRIRRRQERVSQMISRALEETGRRAAELPAGLCRSPFVHKTAPFPLYPEVEKSV